MIKLKSGFKTKLLTTSKGAPVVLHAFIRELSPNIVTIDVALKSRYCTIEATTGGDNEPCGLAIGTDENSALLRSGINRNESTYIEFSDFKNWSVFCASAGRYNLAVCLVKNK